MSKKVILAAAVVAVLAGCGSSVPTAHSPPKVTPTLQATPTAAATPAAVSAATNERLFADGLAQSIPDIPASVVAGPVMHAYAQEQHADGTAFSSAGQPYTSESVTPMAGGFQLCWPDTGSGAGCEAVNQFSTNHAGQVTGVSIEGRPVAGRIATAPPATSDGLTISHVIALRLANEQNTVEVSFKLTDTSYRPQNTSPSLLASLNGASDDTLNDALPSVLAPGDTLYAEAGFDVTQNSGLFCLVANGASQQLPCTTLRKI